MLLPLSRGLFFVHENNFPSLATRIQWEKERRELKYLAALFITEA